MPADTIEKPSGGGTTNITAPIQLPRQNSVPGPIKSSTPPKEILEMTFDSGDLPVLDKSEGHAVIEKETPKNEFIAPKDTKVEPATKSEPKTEETKKEEPKKEEGVVNFLKPPKDETKKEEVKTEVKGEEKKEETKSESGSVRLPSKSEDPFDYKGFNEEETSILKTLSLNAREKVSKTLKEAKAAREGSYLQDPQAYLLHPEYKQAQAEVYYANREGQILLKQLEDVKLGKSINKFKGWDKDGKEIFGEAIQPTDSLEETLRMESQRFFNTANDMQSRMRVFAQNHNNTIKADHQAIEQRRSQLFSWVADPKLLDYTVTTNNGEKSIKNIREDVISLFPVYMRSNPAVQIVGDMMAGLVIKDAEIQSLRGVKQVENIKAKEEEHVEPTSSNKPTPPRNSKGQFGKWSDGFDMSGAPEGI